MAQSTAAAPFDVGGFIIRSSDQVLFHLDEGLLTLASGYFKNMVTATPQGPTSISPSKEVAVEEPSIAIDSWLRMWHPLSHEPDIQSLDVLSEIMDLMDKYDINAPGLLERSQRFLRKYLSAEPMRVFAIAYRFHWRDLALEAAPLTLGKRPLDDPTATRVCHEFNYVPFSVHMALQLYRRKSAETAQSVVQENMELICQCLNSLLPPSECRTHSYAPLTYLIDYPEETRTCFPTTWIVEYMHSVDTFLERTPYLPKGTTLLSYSGIPNDEVISMCCNSKQCKISSTYIYPVWVDERFRPLLQYALHCVNFTLDYDLNPLVTCNKPEYDRISQLLREGYPWEDGYHSI